MCQIIEVGGKQQIQDNLSNVTRADESWWKVILALVVLGVTWSVLALAAIPRKVVVGLLLALVWIGAGFYGYQLRMVSPLVIGVLLSLAILIVARALANDRREAGK